MFVDIGYYEQTTTIRETVPQNCALGFSTRILGPMITDIMLRVIVHCGSLFLPTLSPTD